MLSEVRIFDVVEKAREENVTGVTRKVWEGCLYASTCLQKCAWTMSGRAGRGMRGTKETEGPEGRKGAGGRKAGTRSQDTCTSIL